MVIATTITLDLYNHAKKPTMINAVACDDNSRLICAKLTNRGESFDIGDDVDDVKLTVVRPDNCTVQISGELFSYEEDDTTIYGVQAELDKDALELAGICTAQFKITSGDNIIRTDIFNIDVAKALDSDNKRRI